MEEGITLDQLPPIKSDTPRCCRRNKNDKRGGKDCRFQVVGVNPTETMKQKGRLEAEINGACWWLEGKKRCKKRIQKEEVL